MIKKFILISVLSFSTTALAQDCSTSVYGIKDINCDGEIQIVVMGDSLPYGIGDTKYKNKGGYITRARKKLPKIVIQNLGIQGQTTTGLLSLLKEAFNTKSNPNVKSALANADIVFLDLGRNDRWFFGPESVAVKNILLADKLIQSEVKKISGVSPLVVNAIIMLPNRGSQGPWVKEFNRLLQKTNTTSRPADLRFDLVSKRLLSGDQIHPTSAGYDSLASTFVNYIKRNLPSKVNRWVKKHKPPTTSVPPIL